jgi:hypothetical protein
VKFLFLAPWIETWPIMTLADTSRNSTAWSEKTLPTQHDLLPEKFPYTQPQLALDGAERDSPNKADLLAAPHLRERISTALESSI